MTHWIISANSQIYDHSSSFEHYSYIDWRQGNALFKVNDIVFIYTTRPASMIQYKCQIELVDLNYPNLRDDEEYWLDKNEYLKSKNGRFMRLRLLSQIYNPELGLTKLLENGLNAAPQGPVKVNPILLNYISANFSENFMSDIFPEVVKSDDFEGVKKQITVNKYERSSMARKKCIEYYGIICTVCKIDFYKKYGQIGEGFIHVHHIIPIHKIGQNYKINYKEDLIPVCPNCHSMLHRKINGKEPSVLELSNMINK